MSLDLLWHYIWTYYVVRIKMLPKLFVCLVISIFYGEGFNIKDCWLSIICYLLWQNHTYIGYGFIWAINRVYWRKKLSTLILSFLKLYMYYTPIFRIHTEYVYTDPILCIMPCKQNPYWVCIYRPHTLYYAL
jgi:hypothetical protein